MTPQFRNLPLLPLLGALAVFMLAPAARAEEEAAVQADAASAMQRGEHLVQQGQYREASAEFERASELAGGSCPDCLLGVGRAYSGAKQYDAAIHVTRMALALFSAPQDQARAYDQLGTILALKGEMNAAHEAFGKAVQLDGQMAGQVRSSLAEALLKRASYAQAPQGSAGRAGSAFAATLGVATPQK